MKFIFCFVLFIFLLLQYSIWIGKDGLNKLNINKEKKIELESKLKKLQESVLYIKKEINDLQNSDEALIETARKKLGYIKEGEKFLKFK